MDGEVLGAGMCLQHGRVERPLQAPDHGHAELSGQVGILPVGFHAAAPARVAEDIDVGRPERDALVPVGHAVGQALAVFHAPVVANGRKDFFDQRLVERGRHADGLREGGRLTVARHAVQRFVPPVVGLDAESLHTAVVVPHQGGFFFQAHLGDQAPGPVFGGGLLGTGLGKGCREKGQQQKERVFHNFVNR